MSIITSFLPVILLVVTSMAVHAQGLVRFANITELGVGFQVGKVSSTTDLPDYFGGSSERKSEPRSVPAPRVVTSFGVMVWDLLFIGAGAGYAFQPAESGRRYQHYVPAFAHARAHFAKGRFRPFTGLRIGYNYTLDEDGSPSIVTKSREWDGLLLEPEIGFAIKLTDKALFNIAFAYQFISSSNRGSATYTDLLGNDAGEYTLWRRQHALMLNLGVTFK